MIVGSLIWNYTKMNTKKNKFTVVMSKEHVGASVQQHLRAFSYFQNEGDHFVLQDVVVREDGNVELSGVVENG